MALDKVIIRDLLVSGIVGIYPGERTQPQDILINIVIWTDIRTAINSDFINDTVDYETVIRRIQRYIQYETDTLLLEKMSNDLAQLILKTQPGASRIQLRIEKPTIMPETKAVGVEIERERADYGL
jgi:dihydroneopterin aldolase